MPICPICDDSGLRNDDASNPQFCYCSAGKQARRQWETSQSRGKQPKAASFIDIGNLEEVNANVDALRSTLFGPTASETASSTRHPAVQLLFRVGHPGHEITVAEATQLHDLARVLEGFLGGLGPIGRK
jgi:hypothetical protein